ncbi:hypothetical protein ElyMa_000051300 [Elysia marginata]|uniref:Uncharacterized protein n=1 Tax=Elysia marginata TaxID=1093978 RepID=A0AAV4EE61_9GAST|nr:hypothetical protein ElyMa_000051300 [Elysia marginata]
MPSIEDKCRRGITASSSAASEDVDGGRGATLADCGGGAGDDTDGRGGRATGDGGDNGCSGGVAAGFTGSATGLAGVSVGGGRVVVIDVAPDNGGEVNGSVAGC